MRGNVFKHAQAHNIFLGLALSAVCLTGLAAGVKAQATSQPALQALPADWQKLSLENFAALCESWTASVKKSNTSESKLANYAWTTYLENAQNAAAVDSDQFITLSTIVVEGGDSREFAGPLRAAIVKRFSTDEGIQSLNITNLERLTGSLDEKLLLTKDHSSAWLQTWVDGHKGGADLNFPDAARAWKLLQRHHLPGTFPAVQSLTQNMWDKHLQAEGGWKEVPDAEVMDYYHQMAGILPPAKRAELCQNVWRRLNARWSQSLSTLSSYEMQSVSRQVVPGAGLGTKDAVFLEASFLATFGPQYPKHDYGLRDLTQGVWVLSDYRSDAALQTTVLTGYQAMVKAAISKLALPAPVADFSAYQFNAYQAAEVGRVFETDSDRQQLQDLLGTPVLENRLVAGQILTWSYAYAQKLDDWRKEVTGKIADPKSDPDSKAVWLLVSAVVDEATPKVRDIKLRRPALDKALATAHSELVRLMVLQQLSDYFMDIHRPTDGVTLMAPLITTFTPTGAETIHGFQQHLEANQSSQLSDNQAALARSVASKNSADIAKYQAILDELQRKPSGQ